ncbi:MAG: MmcQ/YjbR family DNA-binding protein [Acidimicrobiia bacterium]|nr:MAG: MmcQ/YjbR family DNA-binding protein [Acidimicrobiia bacterium]
MGSELPYTEADVDAALAAVRRICLDLPEATEKLSHSSPTFFVRKTFVMFHDDHHGDGRLAIWCAAPDGAQALMVESEPERFFVPPYVGHRGWLGVRLDVDVDWDEVAAIVEDAYRTVAPRKLVAMLDAPSAEPPR